MSSFNLAKAGRTIHVGVILFNGENELLDVGTVDLLHDCSSKVIDHAPDGMFPPEFNGQGLDLEIHWVSEKGGLEAARLSSGLTVNPTDSFESCPALDIVIIGANNPGQPTDAELAFIRKSYADSAAFITVCNGVEYALRAGVLAGKTATGPRFFLDRYRKDAPETNWIEKRWVRDGKLWSSGTLLNGMDLMNNFIRATWKPKDGGFIDFLIKGGALPNRDVDYRDVPWSV